MQRITLLILLLTVVYSWEQCKYVLRTIIRLWRIRRRKIHSGYNFETNKLKKNIELDVLVSDIVLIATIPLSLAYLIMSDGSLPTKLLVLLLEFVFLGLILKGIQEYSWRRRFTRHYEGFDKVSGMIFSLVGLVSPTFSFAHQAVRATTKPGKYLKALILPLAAGLALAIAVRNIGREEFVSNLDQLIAIATLGLMLNVTIEILEKIFRANRLHLVSLARILLGVLILFFLISKQNF